MPPAPPPGSDGRTARSKIGFDATAKLPAEGKVRVWPSELAMDPATRALVTKRWKEYGL